MMCPFSSRTFNNHCLLSYVGLRRSSRIKTVTLLSILMTLSPFSMAEQESLNANNHHAPRMVSID